MNPLFPRHTRGEWARGLGSLAVLGGLAVLAWLLYLAAVLAVIHTGDALGVLWAPLRFLGEHFGIGNFCDCNNPS